MSKETTRLQINTVSEHSIICGVCEDGDFVQTCYEDWNYNDTPSKYFRRLGWRVKGGLNVCPKCFDNKRS